MKKHLSRLLAAALALTLLIAPAAALTVPEALQLLEENYYYDIPEEAYEAQSLEELFQTLNDPYTFYMDAEQYAAWLDAVEDNTELVGIGVEGTLTDQGFLIGRLFTGGSAREAGLRAGDLIVAVDGTPCVPATDELTQRLLGREGTRVTVTVLRDGKERDYALTRKHIYIPNTEFTLLDGGVGYIYCDSFGMDTGRLFANGLRQYDSQVNFWVVDMRDNPGGYVNSALEALAAVNGPGTYAYLEDQDGGVAAYGSDTSQVTRKPLILLVNGSSASASELMASGVRDVNLGISVGSRTYGKGVAQITMDKATDPQYFDGDAVKMTVARFYAAGGTTTDRIGVIPTLLVDDEYAQAVALALTGGDEDASDLCVVTGGRAFYIDPDASQEVLSALLSALPPQITLFYRSGTFGDVTPAQAAEKLGVTYDDRWFKDVAGSAYADEINALGAYELLKGSGGGNFTPGARLTRAQLCVMLARVLGVTYTGPSQFSDVAEGKWYTGEVNAMAALGLVNGVGGKRFNPDGALTQEQLLTILGRLARYLNVALDSYGEAVEGSGVAFPPELDGYANWAKSGVAVLGWGLENALDGDGDLLYTRLGNIKPTAPALREEAAAQLYAVLNRLALIP